MKKRIIISIVLLVAVISLTTAFIPSHRNLKYKSQVNLTHPEAGYVENIGN